MKKFLMTINFFLFSTLVFAHDPNQLTIINHFEINNIGQPLHFKIGINPQVLPDLEKNFVIDTDSAVQTRVLDLNKEAYIHVEDDKKNSGFFGIAFIDQQIKFYGYLAKGLAYSYQDQTVTFCSLEAYAKNNGC